jgi:hypothetical protein
VIPFFENILEIIIPSFLLIIDRRKTIYSASHAIKMAKAGKRSPKAIVQTVMAFSLILTIFFALLTVFFPFPLEHIIDRRTQNDTVVTQ